MKKTCFSIYVRPKISIEVMSGAMILADSYIEDTSSTDEETDVELGVNHYSLKLWDEEE